MIKSTCFYVQSPYSKLRANLTVQKSCGPDAVTGGDWDGGTGQDAQVVDPRASSYSALAVRHVDR